MSTYNLPLINLNDYNYHLPDEKIAKNPPKARGLSKLLVYKNNQIYSTKFENILDHLPSGSHLVFNNTKVIPARLFFRNENTAAIEILLLQPFQIDYSLVFNTTDSCIWRCMIGNKKKWKSTEVLTQSIFINDVKVHINVSFFDFDENILKFTWHSSNNLVAFFQVIESLGQMPLPPYLNREPTIQDLDNYQTVFSKELGAVAAPTAGLHFTENLMDKFSEFSVSYHFITLHVGAGTFLPIKEPNVLNHKMHKEQIIFEKEEVQILINNINKIIAVGTTSMRAIESLYWFGVKLSSGNYPGSNNSFFIEKLMPYENVSQISAEPSLNLVLNYMDENNLSRIIGETEIFIFPTYKFRICKGIITNFHQPKSTLLLLISALIGKKWREIYDFALKNEFNFLSYGDSSLLLP